MIVKVQYTITKEKKLEIIDEYDYQAEDKALIGWKGAIAVDNYGRLYILVSFPPNHEKWIVDMEHTPNYENKD